MMTRRLQRALAIGMVFATCMATAAVAKVAFDDPAMVLTEAQQLKLDNINLKSQLVDLLKRNSDLQASVGKCQEQLGPLQRESFASQVKGDLDKLKSEVDKDHAGFEWDPATGAFNKSKPVVDKQ